MHASILVVVVVVVVMMITVQQQQAEAQTTPPATSCVDRARQSRPGLLGGWRKRGSAESPELRQVVKDMTTQAIQSYFDNGQTPTWRVTEVYTQVVAGMNYCIRFKTFETSCAQPEVCEYKTSVCDAHIHRPLPRVNQQPTVKSVQCA